MFEAFDLTGTAWSAAQLTGCAAKTGARYMAIREASGDPLALEPRDVGTLSAGIETPSTGSRTSGMWSLGGLMAVPPVIAASAVIYRAGCRPSRA